MEEQGFKGFYVANLPPDDSPKTNKNVPRGLLQRELGNRARKGCVAEEFQRAAEDKLVLKDHDEMRCHLPEVTRSTFLMVFSPDGTKVASTHGNHNVYVSDLKNGKNVRILSGHPRTPWCIAFHPSSNQILASGCLGGQVRVWDLHGGSEIWTAEGPTVIASLAFHPTDHVLVIATYNEVHFWDWSKATPFTKCQTNNEKEKIRYVAFDPLGHKLITGIANAVNIPSQWDRQPQGGETMNPSATSRGRSLTREQERGIIVCYRSLVEQYDNLVQRYYDLTRNRTTAPTTDRGTDPMDPDLSLQPSRIRPSRLSPPWAGPQPRQFRFSPENLVASASQPLIHRGPQGSVAVEHLLATETRPSQGTTTAPSIDSRAARVVRLYYTFVHNFGYSQERGGEPLPPRTAGNNNLPPEEPQLPSHRCWGPPNTTEASEETRGTGTHTTRSFLVPDYQMFNANMQALYLGRVVPPTQADGWRARRVTTAATPTARGNHTSPPHSTYTSVRWPAPQEDQQSQSQRSEDPRAFPLQPHGPPQQARRFLVSQRSAFQPRSPRLARPDWEETDTSLLPEPEPGSPYRRVTDRELSDSMTEVGVRCGIQLLSRHIDNMQRLCRARLEILQLQQIRRMWEDLQRQIRSLHVAVRESNLALAGTPGSPRPNVPGLMREVLENARDLCSRYRRPRAARRSSEPPPPGTTTPQNPRTSANGSRNDNSDSEDSLVRIALPSTSASSVIIFKRNVLLKNMFGKPKTASRSAGEASTSSGRTRDDRRGSEDGGRRRWLWRLTRKMARQYSIGSRARPDLIRAWRLYMNRGLASSRRSGIPSSASDLPQEEPTLRRSNTGLGDRRRQLSQVSNNAMPPHVKRRRYSLPAEDMPSIVGQESSTGEQQPHPVLSQTSQPATSQESSTGEQETVSQKPQPATSQESSSEDQPTSVTCQRTSSIEQQTITLKEQPSSSTCQRTSVIPQKGVGACEQTHVSAPKPAFAPHQTTPSSSQYRSPSHRLSSSATNLVTSQLSDTSDGSQQVSGHRSGSSGNLQHVTNSRSSSSGTKGLTCAAMSTGGSQRFASHRSGTFGSSHRATSHRSSISSSQRLSSQHSPTSGSQIPSNQRSMRSTRLESSITNLRTSITDLRTSISGLQSSLSGLQSIPEHRQTGREGIPSPASDPPLGTTPQQTPTTPSTRSTTQGSGSTNQQSLGGMIARLEALVRQQRDSANRARGANPWGRRDQANNSASDSDGPTTDFMQLLERRTLRDRIRYPLPRLWRSETSRVAESMHAGGGSTQQHAETRSGFRESTRHRARQVLRLMVESLTEFFEEHGLTNDAPHAILDEQIYSLYTLLHLALELTDLLLVQLFSTRRELEQEWVSRLRSPVAMGAGERRDPPRVRRTPTTLGHRAESTRRVRGQTARSHASQVNVMRRLPSGLRGSRGGALRSLSRGLERLRCPNEHPLAEQASSSRGHGLQRTDGIALLTSPRPEAFTVPSVRVNDIPVTDTSMLNQPRTRPQSPPHPAASSPFLPLGVTSRGWRPRYLHPRHASQGEDEDPPYIPPPVDAFNFIRDSVIITDTPLAPSHRIQAWDFSEFKIPDITNAESNLVVAECKIHNDASVDVSKDGRLLVTLLQSGRLTTLLGVYSLQWNSLGQCLYTTSLEQNAVSVSLSPTNRHLLVGLASRRVTLLPNERNIMAQIYRLEEGPSGHRGRLCRLRDIEVDHTMTYMSLNCIRWIPGPGQGLVLGTNTGLLKVLR